MPAMVPLLAGLLAAAGTLAAEEDRLLQQLRNATYPGLSGGPVTLEDGRCIDRAFIPGGASRQVVTLAPGLIARADLDGDGREEAAVILVESSGGTGSFVYLAAVSIDQGRATGIGTALLGDRVQIRGLTAAPGAITVDTVVAGEQDAAAQPAEKLRRTFAPSPEGLAETAAEPQGPVSLADLDGTAWRLREIQAPGGSAAPTVATLEVASGRLSGHGGCNRWFAEVTDTGRGQVSVGPVAATRMACPEGIMDAEQRFLGLIAQVEWFGFGVGDLILGTPEGVLRLDPAP
jgi:heat shock protein HslJ